MHIQMQTKDHKISARINLFGWSGSQLSSYHKMSSLGSISGCFFSVLLQKKNQLKFFAEEFFPIFSEEVHYSCIWVLYGTAKITKTESPKNARKLSTHYLWFWIVLFIVCDVAFAVFLSILAASQVGTFICFLCKYFNAEPADFFIMNPKFRSFIPLQAAFSKDVFDAQYFIKTLLHWVHWYQHPFDHILNHKKKRSFFRRVRKWKNQQCLFSF